ncbi:capsular biosynthesis protein, partial [Campylobacter sp. TTU_617]|uniref:capsular biosynthesis protein n=1 Tax=Campylobacter sp. TTU_617 TaxID=2768148 RepID=UPI001F2624C2
MQNPNSAIERVKNHLAYKLGQAMIDFASNGGGYCHLFKKLYEIKKQHKKEQKIYQQTIQVFPQLKYPNLETCSDYEQALRYKFHLSYMLGEVLIKADKTWYKGSGFKLKNDIKKAKKEFQIFKEILIEIKELNGKALKAIKDNQQFFLKEFPRIKNILKIHKNYQPILDNIFHNFNYFIQNFDLIEEWLLSDDFNERYKKGNHPYPSLLDPKKLNDENEKINYKNIPAELAWDMNLPLPDKYKFVWLFKSCSGSMAMYNFFTQCEVGCQAYAWENGKKMYTDMKDYFDFFETSIAVVPTITQNYYNGRKLMMYKLLHLFLNIDTIMFIARDPFSIFKHAINHIDNAHVQYNIKPSMKNYKLSTNLFVFPKMHYTYSNSEKPNISSSFEKIFTNDEFYFTTQKRLNILKRYNKIENIECLEIADINKENAFNT